MIRYILVYAVLLGIVAVLLWVGRRFGSARRDGGSSLSGIVGRKSQTDKRQFSFTRLLNLSSLSSRFLASRATTSNSSSTEVKQAIDVLEELYEDFEKDMSQVRTDFSAALEALHRDMDARLSRLEEQMAVVMKAVCAEENNSLEATSVSQEASGSAALPALVGETRVADAGGAKVALDAGPVEGKHFHQEKALSPSHLEAIRKLEEGNEVEEVAQSLGLGVGEIMILKRLSLESGAGQA